MDRFKYTQTHIHTYNWPRVCCYFTRPALIPRWVGGMKASSQIVLQFYSKVFTLVFTLRFVSDFHSSEPYSTPCSH